ncbi:CorA family divalent cation transporter [Paenibacillus sp. TAB 01]|uniref:CorA family divalent cation transporter n=1 Tax=Paenibacillus sp. TAB 01 TaxID=3368988 RepID=UPI0037508F47
MLIHNLQTGEVTKLETTRQPSEHEIAWVHLLNPDAAEVQHVVGDLFHCHPLVVEDCTKLNQRPKLDHYKDHIYISFYAVAGQAMAPHEIGIIVGSELCHYRVQKTADAYRGSKAGAVDRRRPHGASRPHSASAA